MWPWYSFFCLLCCRGRPVFIIVVVVVVVAGGERKPRLSAASRFFEACYERLAPTLVQLEGEESHAQEHEVEVKPVFFFSMFGPERLWFVGRGGRNGCNQSSIISQQPCMHTPFVTYV